MSQAYTGSEIAVVSMACRFPGAGSPEEFWRNLRGGVESIAPLSEEELRRAGVTRAELEDPRYVRAAPLLDGFDRFDASFFGYNALEARLMDPQQRLLLECSWQALEHAGYDPATYPGAIGVYAGTKSNTYLFHLASRPEQLESMDFLQLVLGGDQAMLSTRISYKLDLKGPSYGLQTACSTSLVAVHLACQSLLIDECQMALAGGVAVNVPHAVGYRFDEGGILSPDGHCRPFDAEAAGTVFGSGLGFVVLKRLEDALADGDHVHALILGSATNNDGGKKANFTAPSVEGQTRVILEALACAGVGAESISYVEAHGTGTAVGDPMEVLALSEAFGASTERKDFCAIGSVKSNLGHLDAAAGISSLIKTILALEHEELPPTLHFTRPNPRIDFAGSPFHVQSELAPWPRGERPRRAGVSSLGFGGTNAHVILQEAPPPPPAAAARPWQLLVLSARGRRALDTMGANLARHLESHPEIDLGDCAYTLEVGRRAFDHRRVVVCRDRDQAVRLLAGEATEGETREGAFRQDGTPAEGQRRPIFLFPGQGSQYVGMGLGLYRSEAVFRAEIDRFAEILEPELGCDPRRLLYPEGGDVETAAERLTRTRYAQPALFAVELALARLWASWGARPRAMIGHSLGEYVAACLAGVFSDAEALALVAARGRLIQELPAGAMVAVAAAEEALAGLLGDELAVAAVNGPERVVASGPQAAVAELEAKLAERRIKTRRLHTSHAFHSPMMEPILARFAARVGRVTLEAPRIPFVSNVTGDWIRPEEATNPAYWTRHLRQTVRFADGLATVLVEPGAVFLEVGPGNALATFARRHPARRGEPAIPSLRHPKDGRSDLAVLLAGQGRLWLSGVAVDWPIFYAGAGRRRVPLPAYPFERRRHWIDLAGAAPAEPRGAAGPKKRDAVGDWFYRPVWRPAAAPAAETEIGAAGRWLLFEDDRGLGRALAERLAERGGEVVTVTAGAAFAAGGDGAFTLDPAAPEDYARLLRELADSERRPQAIVHLWSLSADGDDDPGDGFDRQQEQGFYSLLFLAQALAREGAPCRLAVVTAGVHSVTGEEGLCPRRATVLGPCLVLPQELPGVVCQAFDLELGTGAETLAGEASRLAGELLAGAPADAEVAFRDGRRWVRGFEPAPRPESETFERLRRRGVYLVTGGLGLVGSTLAGELARAEARLALVGRTPLPDRGEWRAFVEEHGEEHPVSRKILTARRLERAGAEVLLLTADVTDEAAMRRAVAEAREHFGALHGVLHAAGEASGPAFQAIPHSGREACEVHFGAKARGALVLDRILGEAGDGGELDFVLLNSSLSAVLGGLGNVAYAAANLFLDALAAERRRDGAPWISVDWDAWLDPRAADEPGEVGATLVELSIEPEQGVDALRRVLASAQAGPWIVSTGDLEERYEQWVRRPLSAPPGPAEEAGGHPALTAGELERRIAEVWRDVLDLPRVGRDENFFDLGGNSLSGMQLVAELKRRLGVRIAPVTLFEAPTVGALTAKLRPETTAAPVPALAPAGDDGGAVAVVGMACRFPGADGVEDFWHNLSDGVESITFFSDDELIAAGVDPQLLDDPAYVKARPVLAGAEQFDAGLFDYSPREAERMDPQHRVFLELAWEALENAGHDPARYAGAIGVFGGAAISTYLFNLHSAGAIDPDDPLQTIVGNDKDSLTTSVSYKLGLTGPSVAVQSFCSTSLVAVHMAVRSLRAGECTMALAGGVSIAVPQASGYRVAEGGILSPDGHCRPFDAAAGGTLFGNGAGIVVLKRLRDALADGDRIHAVVRGTAINNDGSLKVGYTAPSVTGQAAVVAAALADAGVDAGTIGYVEAHGTGTSLGDPVEVTALTQAFGTAGVSAGRCALGSVKGNVGHLDRAAGVASLIKAVLALEHGEIPPTLHYQTPNPEIDFDASPFYVHSDRRPWPAGEAPRRAGVSALGFGGTNAHVILEEAPASEPRQPREAARPCELLVLSAATEAAVEASAARLASFLEDQPDVDLGDVAYTLQVGRRGLGHRRALVCRDPADAVRRLRSSERPAAVSDGDRRPVVFLFPGQGAQHPDMGRELYRCEPTFRREIDRCAEVLEPHLGRDLRELLFPEAPSGDAAEDELRATDIAQPALFAVEVALARLWAEWGVEPDAMVGHSIGEVVAACLAGVFSLPDALALVAARGRLMRAQPRGAMLAVSLPEAETAALLDGDFSDLSIAAVNGRRRTVVAGPDEPIEGLAARLAATDVPHRRLHTSHAFHSAMLEPVVEPFARRVGEVAFDAPKLPFIAGATGTWIDAARAGDPAYWATQLRLPVRFADGVDTVLERWPAPIFLEVGPGVTLSRLVRQHLAARSHAGERSGEKLPAVVASMRHPRQQGSDVAAAQEALGRLWLAGRAVDGSGVHRHAVRRRLPLPAYPFERRRLWIGAEASRSPGLTAGRTPDRWLFAPSWRRSRPPRAGEAAGASWLVLSDGGELAEALVDRLAEDRQVAVALPGDGFLATGDATYTLRPDTEADYEALLEALAGRPPAVVLYLWSLAGTVRADDRTSPGDGTRLSVANLLRLGRCLARRGSAAAVRLVAVSSGQCDVLGDEDGAPASAGLTAACRALSEIGPGVACRHLDVDLAPGLAGGRGIRLVEQVLAEASAGGAELCVAYRGAHRWVPIFEALEPEPSVPAASLDGTWLVAGGLEEPGLDLARCLARSAGARLVLLEPEALPPRQTWPEWLAPRDEPTPEELAASLADEGVAAPFPEQLAILEEIPGRARRLSANLARETLPADFEPAVDALCAAYVHRLFADRIDVAAGTGYRHEELRRLLDVAPEGERFFAYLLRMLAEDGLIDLGEEAVAFRALPDRLADPERLRRELEGRFPAFAAGFACLDHCAAHTPQVLSGELDPLSVLYPDGSSRMLGDVMEAQARYSSSRVYRRVIADLLADLASRADPRPLRVLELQAGDGDLTWELVEALRDKNVEYHFTDPGRSFVLNARRQAAQRGLDAVRCRVLEVNGELEPQGLEPYGFDVVVAADAVHTTAQITSTLEWMGRLLAPGGVMLLLEPTRGQRWVTLIWGLLQDWWRFTDFELRRDSPILGADRFEEVLSDLDFAETAVFPRGVEARSVADHSLLVLRQPPQPHTPELSAWAEARWRRRRRSVGDRLVKVSELESLGAEVRWLVAEPSDGARVAAALEEPSIGPLRGVIEATVGGPRSMPAAEAARRDLEPSAYAGALAAAAERLEALEAALAGRRPEHALLVTDVPAAAGEAGYGAGAAVDLFYARRAAAGGNGSLPWRSVVWGLSGDGAPSPEQGAAALAHLLVRDAPRLVVARRPDPAMAEAWNLARPRPAADDLPLAALDAGADEDIVAPRDADERTVAGIWREVLGVERLDVRDPFFELGGDSLIATQLHSRLRDAFGLELPMEKLFEEPTVEGQARALAELRERQESERQKRLLARLAQMSDEEAEAELARMLGEDPAPDDVTSAPSARQVEIEADR